MISLHETCVQYVARRLSEGWRIISQIGFNVILQSPEGIIRPVDLRNDVETLRPNAAGDYTGIADEYPDAQVHYTLVDEQSQDGSGTYVTTAATTQEKDAYNLGATGLGSGYIINSVTVYFCFSLHSTGKRYAQPFLRLGTNETAGTEIHPSGSDFQTYNEILTRPGGGSWAVTDLNSLQVAVGLRITTGGGGSYLTQVYVKVDYTAITVYDETGKLQVILAAQGETETVARLETAREQVILAAVGEADGWLYVETGKEQTILAVSGESDIQAMVETAKLQVVLATLAEADIQTMQELEKLQVISSVLASTDIQTMSETAREQLILAVLGESESLTLDETARLQVLLAVVGESENLTLDEIGKLQVILGVLTSADIQIMQELGVTQVVLAILASADAQTMSELGKLQELLAVVGETEYLTLSETARLQVILSVLGESDIQAMVETSKLQVILAVVGKKEGRLLTSSRTTSPTRVLDAIREEGVERVLDSEIVT